MSTRSVRTDLRAVFARWAVSWCVGAAILGSQVPARADDAGMAVLKSARWKGTVLTGVRGQTGVVAAPGGGPIIGMSSGTITALDRASGKQIWSNQENPLVMGVSEKTVLVYKADRTRRLFALSAADGSFAYDIRIPQEFTHALPGGVHVMGKTVLVESNILTVIQPDITAPTGRVSKAGPPVLTAYDLDTGKELWKNNSPENKEVSYASEPLLDIRTGTEQQVIDPATGKTVWSVPRNGQEYEPLALVPGHVRRADGTWFFLERAGEGDVAVNGLQVIARDGATGKIVGQYKIPYGPGALATVAGELVILREPRKPSTVKVGFDAVGLAVLTEDEKKDKLTALDMQTGKIAWAVAIPTVDGATRIRVADDLLLLRNGVNMIVLEAATGKTLWSESVRAEVVMHNDVMMLTLADAIVGAKRRDGKILWSIPCSFGPCAPQIANGMLYLSITDSGGTAAGREVYAVPLEGNPALAGPRP
jgi:outer membrane protein assembly factor BamB